ncbi:MAG: hypothetical protein HZB25_06715 [Candidatus Eisenbacteria bacterium]|nr:hypothetical protein [Candidatus Eisenbacteria bacterium]
MKPTPATAPDVQPLRAARRLAQLLPFAAAVLTGLLAFRVLRGLGESDAAAVLARSLPAAAAAALAHLPAGPLAIALGALPLAVWLACAWWAARVPGVSRERARMLVGWAWGASVLAGAWALLAGVSGPKPGLAALGYCISWPALGSLGAALVLRRARALEFAAWISGAALLLLLARALPLGWAGQNSWTWWPMLPSRPPGALASGAAWVTGAWLWMLALSRVESRTPRRWATAGLLLVPLMLARGVAQFEHYGPERAPAALASEINTSYFQAGAQVEDPAAFLRGFAVLTDGMPMHAATHPAGWPLLFHAATRAGATPAGATAAEAVARASGADRETADRLAADVARRALSPAESNGLWLLVGLVALMLAAIPAGVYFVARDHESPRVAFRAAGLAAVCAAPLLFFPDVDVAYPALALLAAGSWVRSEGAARRAWALLSGACVGLLAAFSAGNLALLVLLALQAVLSWKRRKATRRGELARGLALLAPLVVLWLGAEAAGHHPVTVLQAVLGHHRDTLAHRGWALWALLNPLDFLVLLGLPAAAWMLRAVPWWHHPEAARKMRMDPGTAVLAAVLGTLLLLDVSGATKGEAGRLWMSYMPLLVAGGASLWRERRRSEWAWLTGMCLALLVALKGFYVFVWLYS